MTEKSYPNIYADEYRKAVSQLTESGAIVSKQDDTHLSFEISLPIGKIKGEVGYIEPTMKVYIKSKPLLISNNTIFKELDKLLSPMTRA